MTVRPVESVNSRVSGVGVSAASPDGAADSSAGGSLVCAAVWPQPESSPASRQRASASTRIFFFIFGYSSCLYDKARKTQLYSPLAMEAGVHTLARSSKRLETSTSTP